MKTKNLFVVVAMTGLVAGCAAPAKKSANPGTCPAKGESCPAKGGCGGKNGCPSKSSCAASIKSNTAPKPFG